MTVCRGCGVEFAGRRPRIYCSNACQRAFERRTRITTWLSGGPATPGSRKGHYIRSFLFADQEGKCAICAAPAAWQGRELVCVLDHIDGDPTNNARSNLRLVCPNCDSQLPTYKNRNRGNGRHYRRQRYADGKSY